MKNPTHFGTVADDRITSPHVRGDKQLEASPILSGEVGFIVSAVAVILLFGILIGATAATWTNSLSVGL